MSLRFLILALCAGVMVNALTNIEAGIISNQLVRIEFPDVGEAGSVRIFYRDRLASDDNWYYLVTGSMQHSGRNVRSRGRVVKAEVTPLKGGGSRLLLLRLTDDRDEPDLGAFEMSYELRAKQAAIRHEAVFTPKRPLRLQSCHFFVRTEKPTAQMHQFHSLSDGWRIQSRGAKTNEPYGRIAFNIRHPWLALEEVRTHTLIALGAPPVDVTQFMFSIELKRFELSRVGGWITPDEPVRELALISFGSDAAALVEQQKAFERTAKRPPRSGEARMPSPTLNQPPPADRFDVGVETIPSGWRVNAGDFQLTFSRAGALTQWKTDAGQWLAQAGGMNYLLWPDKKRIGPAGQLDDVHNNKNEIRFRWSAKGIVALHRILPKRGYVLWEATIPNGGSKNLLMELRLSLPVRLEEGRWFYWNGQSLLSVDSRTRAAEMTTLAPGQTLSQGIFPAVCVHSRDVGMAVGLEPMDIESFYGARVRPALGPLETFYYVVRLAAAPGAQRRVRFVLFATDPNWSWRSLISRYWRFWPRIFARPERDDIWGLYAASSPLGVYRMGDKFIDLCRRMRVGGMELYAPFNKTGDFYPDVGAAYVRGKIALSREQMRQVYETANIASCNLSYVIPTKCERKMATTTYTDSVIRLADGSFFLRDYWDVMGGKREKLAAMFARGDSFGENLRRELRRIVEDYQPDGFYLDNGAFVWEDYGRMTEWSAFDDDGRIYTNGGIPYAKLLDELRAFAPNVQRNPGEFIQYFSGFRGQSHLTNVVSTQRFYVRTHRLIMGRKPIFPDHPNRITKDRLYDALELGGLPWLAGLRRDREALAREWAPVAIALARAGWQPIPNAVTGNPSVRIERFGAGQKTFFTVRNLAEEPIKATLRLVGRFPRLSEFRRAPLNVRCDDKAGATSISLRMPASELVVLRATPSIDNDRKWPNVKFLADAAPTSIVASADPVLSPKGVKEAAAIARRIKGFIVLQAELLGKQADVEIVSSEARAKFAHRVIVRKSVNAALTATDERTLLISGPDARSMRAMLWDYFDAIEVPLSEAPPRWRLAAPGP